MEPHWCCYILETPTVLAAASRIFPDFTLPCRQVSKSYTPPHGVEPWAPPPQNRCCNDSGRDDLQSHLSTWQETRCGVCRWGRKRRSDIQWNPLQVSLSSSRPQSILIATWRLGLTERLTEQPGRADREFNHRRSPGPSRSFRDLLGHRQETHCARLLRSSTCWQKSVGPHCPEPPPPFHAPAPQFPATPPNACLLAR